jgi:hypothetical protein
MLINSGPYWQGNLVVSLSALVSLVWPGIRVLMSVVLRLACRLVSGPMLFAGICALMMAAYKFLGEHYHETARCVIDAWFCGTVVALLGWLQRSLVSGPTS